MLRVTRQPSVAPPDSMWKPLAEERAAKIALLEKRLLEREESAPPPWPSERTITIILTVHGDKRLPMAREAYRSILAAGFRADQIRICLTHNPGSDYGAALIAFTGVANVDQLGPIDNNSAWLQSCERAESSHIIVLHDDDLMKPGLAAKLKERDGWDGACWDADFFDGSDGHSSYFRCRDGIYHGALASDIASRLYLTPSTIQACWPRHFIIEALREFSLSHNDLELRPGMKIGNDLLLWLRMGKIGKLWVIRERFSQCRHHHGSTTVANETELARLYSGLRLRLGFSHRKIAQICHLWGSGVHPRFMESIQQNKPNSPIRFLSSRALKGVDSIRIPNYETGSMADPRERYGAANCAFSEAAKIAVEDGADALFYIETDCRFSGEGWDEVLRQEFFGAGPNVSCVGSPVVWGALSAGNKRALAIQRYACDYTEETGLFMAYEGQPNDGNFALYPNGALAFYTPEILEESYLSMVRMVGVSEYARTTEPYDLHIGRILGSKGVDVATRRVGWLRSSYSGCLNHHYTLEDRLKMLASGERVAVHQVKS